jgi:hypothetical protein
MTSRSDTGARLRSVEVSALARFAALLEQASALGGELDPEHLPAALGALEAVRAQLWRRAVLSDSSRIDEARQFERYEEPSSYQAATTRHEFRPVACESEKESES